MNPDICSGSHAKRLTYITDWAEHGIAGRGVLLDFRGYAHRKGIQYDPYDYYPISFEALFECGKDQGIDIRPAAQGGDIKIGDILFIRTGWTEQYWAKTPEDRRALGMRDHVLGRDDPSRYAGIAQEEKVLDWLHDCYFAAVSGDAPSFEAWPSHEGTVQTLSASVLTADTRTHRILFARVHPCSLGHAARRNVGSGEAGPDVSGE